MSNFQSNKVLKHFYLSTLIKMERNFNAKEKFYYKLVAKISN